ncbi:MAG: hypothetical protein ACLFSQ_07750 [Candidatus Zixiibacteriota bacterium]
MTMRNSALSVRDRKKRSGASKNLAIQSRALYRGSLGKSFVSRVLFLYPG